MLPASLRLRSMTTARDRPHEKSGIDFPIGLREGLQETLTIINLGIDDALYRTFRTTNPIENLNGLIAHHTRNVKRWRDGEMVLRWVGTALNEASHGFRAVRGFRDMKRLVAALEQHVQPTTDIPRKIA